MDTMMLILLSIIDERVTMDEETGSSVANKVSFQKSSTRMDLVEYVSIQLESTTDSIQELLEKAMNVTEYKTIEQKKVSIGAIA